MLPLWMDAGVGVRVVRLTTAGEIEALIRLFEGVAEAEGWQPAGALRLWRERSVYVGLEVEGVLAGGLQLVLPVATGTLPYQTTWPEVPPASHGRQAHVAILALDGTFRGKGILFWRLVVEMWRYCVVEGVATLSIEVTPRVLPIYKRLGWPLQVQGELRRHWGEDCYYCTLEIPKVAEALLCRAESSGYYREIIAQAFRVNLPSRPRRNLASEPASAVALC